MRFFIYSRKSVYTGKGESIENQIEMCRQYIAVKYAPVNNCEITVYEDEGFSAKNTQRPRFQQMLRDIRENKPDFVVCYRLDRVSRSVSDFSALIEELDRRGVSFVCIKEEFDTSNPMGKAMMYIASVFAQLERETIAERVRDNMRMLARAGRWLGGTAPTGYACEKVREVLIDGRKKTSCCLKDNPEELIAVDAIFDQFLERHSVSGVSRYLVSQGIQSRVGRSYSLQRIKEILQNPVYCIADRDAMDYFTAHNADVCFAEEDCSAIFGLLAYSKRDYHKARAPRQSIDNWIVAIGRHRGRVTGKKWAAVQRIIEENIPTGRKPAKMHNDYSLLSGLIYCGRCAGRMFAKRRAGKQSGCDLFDYVCEGKLRGGTKFCSCQNIGGQQADGSVCNCLMRFMNGGAGIVPFLEKLKQSIGERPQADPLAAVDTQIHQYTEEACRLLDVLSRGDLGAAFIQRVRARVGELENTLSKLNAQRGRLLECAGSDGAESRIDAMASALTSLRSCFEELSVYEKRALIKMLTQRIVWDGENLHVFMSGVRHDVAL